MLIRFLLKSLSAFLKNLIDTSSCLASKCFRRIHIFSYQKYFVTFGNGFGFNNFKRSDELEQK